MEPDLERRFRESIFVVVVAAGVSNRVGTSQQQGQARPKLLRGTHSVEICGMLPLALPGPAPRFESGLELLLSMMLLWTRNEKWSRGCKNWFLCI